MATNQILTKIPGITAKKPICSQCSLNSLCLPTGLNKDELQELEGLVQSAQTVKENEALFRQNDPFETLYAVRSGIFKSTIINNDGHEHITAFYLPGELIGLDAIYKKQYQSNTFALDTASICILPYEDLSKLSRKIPGLQQQLLRLLSKELNDANSQILTFHIEQRLAAFIFDLSTRYHERGYSRTHLNLAMSRQDIANHLNMAPETISRLFKRMQNDGLLKLNRRELIVEDMDKLKELAGCKPI